MGLNSTCKMLTSDWASCWLCSRRLLCFTKPRITEWVQVVTRFTFYFDALARNRWYTHCISGEFISHQFKFVHVAITELIVNLFTLTFIPARTFASTASFPSFSSPSQGITKGLSSFCLWSKELPGDPPPPFGFLAPFSSLFCAARPCMLNLFVASMWWNGRSVSFHVRFADWWTLCPGLTQAAPKKKMDSTCKSRFIFSNFFFVSFSGKTKSCGWTLHEDVAGAVSSPRLSKVWVSVVLVHKTSHLSSANVF